jgi:hypothetical protein
MESYRTAFLKNLAILLSPFYPRDFEHIKFQAIMSSEKILYSSIFTIDLRCHVVRYSQ